MFCRFGHVYHNVQNRLTKILIHAFLDPAKSFTQHYGAVQGISALGPSAVEPNQCKLILCLSHADCICCLQIRLLLLPTSWHICNFWSQNCNLRSRKWDENEGSLACLWCLAGQFRALTQFILLYFGWATKGKLSFLPLGCIFQCAAGKCLYDRLKLFPVLLSPSTCPLLRSDKRVLTNNPSKYFIWTPISQMVQTICTRNG